MVCYIVNVQLQGQRVNATKTSAWIRGTATPVLNLGPNEGKSLALRPSRLLRPREKSADLI